MDLEVGCLLAMDDGAGRKERWNFCSEGRGGTGLSTLKQKNKY